MVHKNNHGDGWKVTCFEFQHQQFFYFFVTKRVCPLPLKIYKIKILINTVNTKTVVNSTNILSWFLLTNIGDKFYIYIGQVIKIQSSRSKYKTLTSLSSTSNKLVSLLIPYNSSFFFFILKGNKVHHCFLFIFLLLLPLLLLLLLLLIKGNHVIHKLSSIFLCIWSNTLTFEEISRYAIPPYAFFYFSFTWFLCFLGCLYLDLIFWNGQFVFNRSKDNIKGKVVTIFVPSTVAFFFKKIKISKSRLFKFNIIFVWLQCHDSLCFKSG